MNANTLFPLATIALLAVGIARGALCAEDPVQAYGDVRHARASAYVVAPASNLPES